MDLLSVEELSRRLFTKNGLLICTSATTAFSAYVPERMGDRLIEKAFVYTLLPGSRRSIPRPFAWLGVDSVSGQLLFYQHCAHTDFVSTTEYPPEMRIDLPESPAEAFANIIEYKKVWHASYAQLREFAFLPEGQLTEVQRQTVRDYDRLFPLAVIPGLVPFYHALSPSFFEWLSAVV